MIRKQPQNSCTCAKVRIHSKNSVKGLELESQLSFRKPSATVIPMAAIAAFSAATCLGSMLKQRIITSGDFHACCVSVEQGLHSPLLPSMLLDIQPNCGQQVEESAEHT